MNLQYIKHQDGTQELEALLNISPEIASKTKGYANAVEQTVLQNTPAIHFNEDYQLGEVFELNNLEIDISRKSQDPSSDDIEHSLSDLEYITEGEEESLQKNSDGLELYSDSESIDPFSNFEKVEEIEGYEDLKDSIFEQDNDLPEGTFAENQLEAELSRGALNSDMDRVKYLAERVEKEIVI